MPVRLKESSFSPEPCRMMRLPSAGSFFQGVEREKPMALEIVSTIFMRQDLEPSGHGATAPALIPRSWSGTILSGSTPIRVPRPEQAGQAP